MRSSLPAWRRTTSSARRSRTSDGRGAPGGNAAVVSFSAEMGFRRSWATLARNAPWPCRCRASASAMRLKLRAMRATSSGPSSVARTVGSPPPKRASASDSSSTGRSALVRSHQTSKLDAAIMESATEIPATLANVCQRIARARAARACAMFTSTSLLTAAYASSSARSVPGSPCRLEIRYCPTASTASWTASCSAAVERYRSASTRCDPIRRSWSMRTTGSVERACTSRSIAASSACSTLSADARIPLLASCSAAVMTASTIADRIPMPANPTRTAIKLPCRLVFVTRLLFPGIGIDEPCREAHPAVLVGVGLSVARAVGRPAVAVVKPRARSCRRRSRGPARVERIEALDQSRLAASIGAPARAARCDTNGSLSAGGAAVRAGPHARWTRRPRRVSCAT